MNVTPRFALALLVGAILAVAMALVATLSARLLWPAYSLAEPERAYDFAMLLARLTVGAACILVAAGVATIIARDSGKAALWLGGLFLAISLPIHLFGVWADYPAWYHLVYLGYILPVAVIGGRLCLARRQT